jgi:hypothetical protein
MILPTTVPTTRDRLLALAARCQAASGPDRELDEAIAVACYPSLIQHNERGEPRWYMHGVRVRIEDYSASLDAALSLVRPEGLDSINIHRDFGEAEPWCAEIGYNSVHSSTGATPALALCAAALRARAALA